MTRWSGHKRAIDGVRDNFKEVINTLIEIKSGARFKFDGEDVATAIGILNAIQQPDFIFMLLILKRVLDILEPVNKMLQSHEMSYSTATPLIDFVIEEMKNMQEDQIYDEIQAKADAFLAENVLLPTETSSRRVHIPSVLLSDYEEVTVRTGQRDLNQTKKSFHQVLKVMVDEMDRRFTEKSDILKSISASNEMELKSLEPLSKIGFEMPSQAEMDTAKAFIEKRIFSNFIV